MARLRWRDDEYRRWPRRGQGFGAYRTGARTIPWGPGAACNPSRPGSGRLHRSVSAARLDRVYRFARHTSLLACRAARPCPESVARRGRRAPPRRGATRERNRSRGPQAARSGIGRTPLMTRPSPTVVSGHADPAGLSVGPPRGATRPPAAAPGPGAGPAAFVGQLALVAVAYFAAARAGLALATVADQVTIVWPSAGIALGALVLFGYRAWPAVTVGAFLANAAHAPAATAGAIAIGNTLEALAGAWMLRRLAGFDAALERVKDVLGLLVLAAGLSTTVSATVGVTTLCATGVRPWSDYSLLWGVWWMGDAMGDLVVAPLLLTWAGWRRLPWGPWRVPEVVALVGGVLAVSVSVFAEPYALVGHPAMAYALFPFMIWAALRFGPPVAALATALASALAVQGTVLGYGPYQAATVLESLILVQLFMAVVATTTLVLAAVTTERARAENSVRQGYALLRAVIDGTTDAVFVKDREGRYLMINGAGAEFLGKTVAQVLGQDDTRLFSPETARAIMEADGRIMATGEVHTYEEVGTAAGVTRTYLSTKGPYRDADGTICGMIGISRDITERKQAEERFRLVVESGPTGLVMTDRAGRIVLVNEQTERLFGYGRDELLGRSVEVLVPDGYRACHPAHRAGFFAQPTRRPMGAGREVYGRRRDGSEFPVELGLAPIRTADGVLVLSVIVDIIERKRAEEARARLAAIVELSEDAILSMSLDGVVQTWNRAAEKMYGYSALEILGRPIAPLIPPDRRDEAAANLRQVGHGRRLENHETVRTRKDGTQIDISLSISPLPDASGRVTAVAKIARDITPRKSDERRLAAEHAVTRALAESTNLDGAAPEILRTIGETLGGDLGVLWEVSPDPDRLRCAAVWRPPGQPAGPWGGPPGPGLGHRPTGLGPGRPVSAVGGRGPHRSVRGHRRPPRERKGRPRRHRALQPRTPAPPRTRAGHGVQRRHPGRPVYRAAAGGAAVARPRAGVPTRPRDPAGAAPPAPAGRARARNRRGLSPRPGDGRGFLRLHFASRRHSGGRHRRRRRAWDRGRPAHRGDPRVPEGARPHPRGPRCHPPPPQQPSGGGREHWALCDSPARSVRRAGALPGLQQRRALAGPSDRRPGGSQIRPPQHEPAPGRGRRGRLPHRPPVRLGSRGRHRPALRRDHRVPVRARPAVRHGPGD